MQNYSSLNSLLQNRNAQRRKLANHTYAQRKESGDIVIRLHQTEIVTFKPDGTIIANTGGWKTHITKDRLNEYLPVRIWLKSGRWFLGSNGESLEFADGITFHKDGTITGAKGKTEANKELATKKRIDAYCKALQSALPLPIPGAGDCWYCLMREEKTKLPLGEFNHDTGHLESHFEESYFVPSLVWRVLEFAGCNPQGGGCAWFQFAFGKEKCGDWQAKTIARFVKKYLRRQFGLA